jgi:hypothetical protein
MKVIDNFLPQAYQDAIQNLMLKPTFPWYLNVETSAVYGTAVAHKTTTDGPQFTHTLFRDGHQYSEHHDFLSLIMHHLMLTEGVDTTGLIRAKANLNIPANDYPKDHHYVAHTDCPSHHGYITAIYYVNDSCGDTKFFTPSGEVTGSISPKKGRLVYFDGGTYHAGRPPENNGLRCVLIFNFKAKETK